MKDIICTVMWHEHEPHDASSIDHYPSKPKVDTLHFIPLKHIFEDSSYPYRFTARFSLV